MKSRTQLLLGAAACQRLSQAHVLIVGLGGVGGYAAEMLARAGIGTLTIVDGDHVSESNINRQLIALHSTVDQSKTALFACRLSDINPELTIHPVNEFIRDERLVELLEKERYDCVVDAIDTLSPKVFLLYHARRLALPVVSAMGSGGRRDGSRIHVSDISRSFGCPLAAMVRKRLRRMEVYSGIQVVFSDEPVPPQAMQEELTTNHRTTLGTVSYMPALFGCRLAEQAINLIINPTI